MKDLVLMAISFSSVWAFFDAKKIGIGNVALGKLGRVGPWTWFFGCLLIWIIFFPMYLVKRAEFLKQKNVEFSDVATAEGLSKETPTQNEDKETASIFRKKAVDAIIGLACLGFVGYFLFAPTKSVPDNLSIEGNWLCLEENGHDGPVYNPKGLPNVIFGENGEYTKIFHSNPNGETMAERNTVTLSGTYERNKVNLTIKYEHIHTTETFLINGPYYKTFKGEIDDLNETEMEFTMFKAGKKGTVDLNYSCKRMS